MRPSGCFYISTSSNIFADTSEYPNNHSWICFAQDENLSADILEVVQSAADAGPRSILDMTNKLLTALSKKVFANKAKFSTEEELYDSDRGSSVEDDDDSVYNVHSDDEELSQFGIPTMSSGAEFDLAIIKQFVIYPEP